jgi:hypothetical protein
MKWIGSEVEFLEVVGILSEERESAGRFGESMSDPFLFFSCPIFTQRRTLELVRADAVDSLL